MRNKELLAVALLVILLPFQWAYIQKATYPNEQIQPEIIDGIEKFKINLKAFTESIKENKEKEELIRKYKSSRKAYKGIETYVVYRLPDVDKAINGGPVPSMTVDVVILHKDDPTGLQVIEELLAEDQIDKELILKNLKYLEKKVEILIKSFALNPIQNWEILDANHLAITKLITLSLSGFDSPAFLLSIEDATVVLEQLMSDLMLFETFVPEEFNFIMLNELAKSSINNLTKTKDFESLDRFEFYRDYLLPLQTKIKELHRITGYETYREVTTIKRSIAEGDHLFSKDYLDPFYSLRGNNTTHNQDQIALGKILFFDPILSKNNKRSCASCHSPQKAFTDGLAKSLAFDFKGNVERNSPTLINTCYQSNFFWDLRSKDMNDQIVNVMVSPDEFNMTTTEIVSKLKLSKEYQELFKKAYFAHKEPINVATVKTSLELYVRSIVALNSKFDQNIRSEKDDYTDEEKLGANLFLGKAACATCHFPPNFNGFVPPHYRDTEGEILGTTKTAEFKEFDSDYGMYNRFGKSYPDADYTKGMFKTPTIRNVEYTAPYMHNGMFTLEEVVDFYNNGGGLGHGLDLPQQTLAADSLHLTEIEKGALITFMKTLSDTVGTVVQPFPLPIFEDESLNNRKWGGEY